MQKAILFNFLVDKEKKEIKVERLFEASLPIVWRAWTDSKILDQWWGPQPWKARTVSMDFREGGHWFYSMNGPESDPIWCLVNYKTIEHQKRFTSDDAFCNEKREINTSFPSNRWNTEFETVDDDTMVNVTLSFERLEDLEQIVQMGFKEGFTQGLNQLDEWLNQQKQ